MSRELIERIEAEISALDADISTFRNALGDDAELGAEIKTLAVLKDCKAAVSKQAEPVASVPQDVETWIAAKKYYTTIARPEAFDGTESVSVAELREFFGAWMAGHVRVPEEADPLPDNYSSWDVGYNAGWNACREAMLTASKESGK